MNEFRILYEKSKNQPRNVLWTFKKGRKTFPRRLNNKQLYQEEKLFKRKEKAIKTEKCYETDRLNHINEIINPPFFSSYI